MSSEVVNNIKVSAPGSIMLMGEHAVVHGHLAIVCAVNKFIDITLVPRADRAIKIYSVLADYESSLDDIAEDARLSFVIQCIKDLRQECRFGFELHIDAGFSHTVGLGSSAAVTVAAIKAITRYIDKPVDRYECLALALSVVHKVQGRGSGSDLAASVFGGVISYQINPCEVKQLSGVPELALYYSGYKTKTADVLEYIEQRKQLNSTLYDQFYLLMHKVTVEACTAIEQENWRELGLLMDMYQGLMDGIGVSDLVLSQMIYRLRNKEEILGVKISGSGLGDCVVTLGGVVELDPFERIDICVSTQGVLVYDN